MSTGAASDEIGDGETGDAGGVGIEGVALVITSFAGVRTGVKRTELRLHTYNQRQFLQSSRKSVWLTLGLLLASSPGLTTREQR